MLLSENPVLAALHSRRSVRAFLSDPVDEALVRIILQAAACSPSGNNIQPWKVHVAMGEARHRLSDKLLQAYCSDAAWETDYPYYPASWREPYLSRRRAAGWSLYRILGIETGDRAASKAQHARNFEFFDAPVVMFVSIDRDLGQGSWLDVGLFVQSIMTAARAVGLHTCPQVALVGYPDIVRETLSIPTESILLCGISLGFEDTRHPANQLRTGRVPVDEFAVFNR